MCPYLSLGKKSPQVSERWQNLSWQLIKMTWHLRRTSAHSVACIHWDEKGIMRLLLHQKTEHSPCKSNFLITAFLHWVFPHVENKSFLMPRTPRRLSLPESLQAQSAKSTHVHHLAFVSKTCNCFFRASRGNLAAFPQFDQSAKFHSFFYHLPISYADQWGPREASWPGCW